MFQAKVADKIRLYLSRSINFYSRKSCRYEIM